MFHNDRYLNTFISQLGRNRMGQSFMKTISRSLDRKEFRIGSNRRETTMRRTSVKRDESKQKRVKTESGIGNFERMSSFRIKEGSLGESIRVIDSPRRIQEKSLFGSLLGSRNLKSGKPSSQAPLRSSSRDRSFTKFNSLMLNKREIIMMQFLSRRSELLRSHCIGQILLSLSGNATLSSLRIYRQRFHRFYCIRYMREKLTSFLEFENVQDYDSQIRILQSLLSFKLEEIYYLCFLVMDQNGDGLICGADLFAMATASSNENPLISKDIYKIYEYVAHYRQINAPIVDAVCDEDDFRLENSTIQKYRLFEAKKEREKQKNRRIAEESIKKDGSQKIIISDKINKDKKVIVTRKTNHHLFSFRREEEQGQAAIKQLRKKFAEITLESRSNFGFKVNFSTFKTIFANSIPETYFDLLYVQGGIKLPNKTYLPLNFNLDEAGQREMVEVTVDRFAVFERRLARMRQFRNVSSTLR